MPAPSPTELFDPSFIQSLEALRILARRVPTGGRHAEQRSRARGAGVEFTDVRPYTPGDDFRAIDWHLFERLDKLYLRLFLEEEDLPIYFLLDQSGSMAQPPAGRAEPRDKTLTARRVVAALAYVALHHMDRVFVFPFAAEPLRPLRGLFGHAAFHRLLAWVADLDTEGGTGLCDSLRAFANRRLRRGLCVVVSDFLDPRGADAVTATLRQMPHRLLLLRVVHPGEDRPTLTGELEVEDCEDGRLLQVHIDDALLDRYQAAWRAFGTALEETGTRRGGGYFEVRTDQPLVPQLATLFPRGALRA